MKLLPLIFLLFSYSFNSLALEFDEASQCQLFPNVQLEKWLEAQELSLDGNTSTEHTLIIQLFEKFRNNMIKKLPEFNNCQELSQYNSAQQVDLYKIMISIENFGTSSLNSGILGKELFENLLLDSISNGDVSVSDYNPKMFSLDDAKKELIKDWEESFGSKDDADSCQFEVTVGVKDNEKLLRTLINEESIYMEESIANVFFDTLFGSSTQVKFNNIVSLVWDQKSGDSEYCNVYRFAMFTTDGQRLYIDSQNTD